MANSAFPVSRCAPSSRWCSTSCCRAAKAGRTSRSKRTVKATTTGSSPSPKGRGRARSYELAAAASRPSLKRHPVMHRIALDAVVGVLQAGVRVVNGTNTHLMPACEAQARAQLVFELEGRAQFFPLDLGALERRDADTRSELGLDRSARESVHEYRRQREAVIGGGFVTFPVGVTRIPITGQPPDTGLEPAAAEIELHTEPISHG